MIDKSKIKAQPDLFLFGNMCDFGSVINDLKLIHEKTESLDFEEPDIDIEPENILSMDCFPQIPREGFIVMLIIAFENAAREFVSSMRILDEYPVSWGQIRGNSFDKLSIFAKNFSKLEVDIPEEYKTKMRNLIEVRNCIVHSNSNIDEFNNSKSVVRIINDLADCKIEDGYIFLSKDGCFECADLVERVVSYYYKAALKKYPNSK